MAVPDRYEEAFAAYVRFYETLTPARVGELRALAVPEMHFRDPFNDVRDVERVVAIFAAMYERMAAPVFHVLDTARTGNIGYIRWTFSFRRKKEPETAAPWLIEGVTRVELATDGRVLSHIDYWDAAGELYERVPILGGVLRFLRRRIAAVHG